MLTPRTLPSTQSRTIVPLQIRTPSKKLPSNSTPTWRWPPYPLSPRGCVGVRNLLLANGFKFHGKQYPGEPNEWFTGPKYDPGAYT